MKNCIEIKDDMAKTIRVNKGNFYFTFDLDKKLFVECLEGERYINTNPAVSISRFRNAFERFAAITEGNRRIVQSAKKDIDRTSVYDKVHNEIGKPNAKYVKDGKEYNVTAKGLFVDTLFELQKKDKNALNLGIKYLNDNNVVGIFPEGTRNKTKELLQPFKFGAVSMAKKTNATIIPFAITGEYKWRTKNLTLEFGKPFKIGDMTLEEANDKLYNEILNIIKKNKN